MTKISDLTPDKGIEYSLIYALCEPTWEVRYIGKSTDPIRRMRRHFKDARDGKKDHKSRWIASLINKGMLPHIKPLEICTLDNWKERECYWIEHYRTIGADLTNHKDGGDGCNPNDITRQRMSAARKGKTPHNKGKCTSIEIRKKQSLSAKNRFARMTPDEIRVYVEPLLNHPPHITGHAQTKETRNKISQSLIGNKRSLGYRFTQEQRDNLSRSLKGHITSEETKQKIGMANKLRAQEKHERKVTNTSG
jgi:hypothetical protein